MSGDNTDERHREFETFFLAASQRTVGVVAIATGDVGLAEEAVQEAFLRAFARWDSVRTLERPDLWVLRVSSRLAIDAWRRRRPERPPSATAPAAVADLIQGLWIRWSLDQLTPAQRLVVVLAKVEGRTTKEVATLLKRSPETVKSHLFTARHRLRKMSQEEIEG